MFVQVKCMFGLRLNSSLALRHKSRVRSDVEPPEATLFSVSFLATLILYDGTKSPMQLLIPAPHVKSTKIGWCRLSSFMTVNSEVTPAMTNDDYSHQVRAIIGQNNAGNAPVWPITNLFRFWVEKIRLISKAWRLWQESNRWFSQTHFVRSAQRLQELWTLSSWFQIGTCLEGHCAPRMIVEPSSTSSR